MIVLLAILLLALVAGWLILADRIKALDSRLFWANKQDKKALERELAELTARVSQLEQQLGSTLRPETPPHEQAPEPQRIPTIAPTPEPVSLPRVESEPQPLSSPTPLFSPAPQFTTRARARPAISGR